MEWRTRFLQLGYFSTVEVQTVLSMLRLLDNPRQDIPMAAVLRSPMAGLTDEELAVLRLEDGSVPFHEAVLELAEGLFKKRTGKEISDSEADQAREETRMKTENHIEITAHRNYSNFIKIQAITAARPGHSIHELIEIILREIGYGHYVAAMLKPGKQKNGEFKHAFGKSRDLQKTELQGTVSLCALH